MEKTVITQNNTQVLMAPETYEYKIETSVSEKGELPFVQIFVFTIVDSSDPSLDVFARVATPGDLGGTTALLTARDAAITAGATEYLSSYFSVQYPDVTIAAQAKSAVTTRINDLINNWIIYRDQFMLYSGEEQYFPTTDPAFEQSLKDDYATAKQTRIAAEQALLLSATDLTLAQKDAANTLKIYEIYKKEVEFCQKTHIVDWAALNGALTSLLSAEGAMSTDSKSAFCALAGLSIATPLAWPITDPPTTLAQLATTGLIPSTEWADWYNAIVDFETARTAYTTTGAPARTAVASGFQTFCSTAASNSSLSYNANVAAESDVSDAVLNKKEAEAELVAAQAAEAAALAAVMEVCPTFDPASV
jgi:hypothetical protein